MRRNWLFVIAILVAGLGAWGYLSWKSTSRNDDIVIGATLPLSGDAALWGKNTQDGIELALSEINAAGGVNGQNVRVVYEDTRALAQVGVNAYHKLESVDRVPAIIDDSVSSVTLAMAPIAKKDGVVILSTGATAPRLSQAGIFRIWNSDAYEGEVAAHLASKTLRLSRVAVLYINNDYGTGLEQVFTTAFVKLGGQVVESEAFGQSQTDVRTQLAKIKGANPDGIYLVGYPKEIPIALRQARELGLNVPCIGTVAAQDPQLLQSAGVAAEGLMYPFPIEARGDLADKFKAAFLKRYNKAPGITSDVGYDAIKMIVAAIKASGGKSGDDIRRGLRSLHEYPGVSGVMTFDANGDVHKPMGIKIVKNGKFEWMK
jgi:branched-chain amino acid transport system substrate-binding protein